MNKIIYLFCFVFICACTLNREVKEENLRLRKEVDSLKLIVLQKQEKYDVELSILRSERDSFKLRLNTIKDLSDSKKSSLVYLIDSLKIIIAQRENLLTDCQSRKEKQDEVISQLRARIRALYHIDGNEAKKIEYNHKTYDCYSVNITKCNLQFYWKYDRTQQPIRSFENLLKMLEQDSHKLLIFATNAGMYTSENAPRGLYIQDGKVLVPVDRKREEYGNFYVQPNGIFLVDTAGVAKIIVTDEYTNEMAGSIRFATQSGPMVVVNGAINTYFRKDSENLNIRSGVGILSDGRPIFVISNQPVNFYDFASVFKERLGCKFALYLDGAVSLMYLPEAGRFENGGNFGPIIGVTRK